MYRKFLQIVPFRRTRGYVSTGKDVDTSHLRSAKWDEHNFASEADDHITPTLTPPTATPKRNNIVVVRQMSIFTSC